MQVIWICWVILGERLMYDKWYENNWPLVSLKYKYNDNSNYKYQIYNHVLSNFHDKLMLNSRMVFREIIFS